MCTAQSWGGPSPRAQPALSIALNRLKPTTTHIDPLRETKIVHTFYSCILWSVSGVLADIGAFGAGSRTDSLSGVHLHTRFVDLVDKPFVSFVSPCPSVLATERAESHSQPRRERRARLLETFVIATSRDIEIFTIDL